ncbi:MAG: ACP S-malonyltransferase [Clostridia bacterium]|jgi:[acyl-carrier-protein] S-malonyltransferase|nr:ACP S-malonyltransferase [Clostridia bacterium]MDD3231888.1 ACP S-malonyltransferase [Clostridia bacterium]MDD3862334.1 ACP S-malonyltransferase [Clostridia bacterium]
MKKTAILFAGQGSQYIKMGQDFYGEFDYVKDIYKKANSILGYNLEDICFKENDLINQTIYTQPCVLVTSIAIYTALLKELNIIPNVMCGFSLGEYGALYAAKIFDFETIIKLIKHRAEFMQNATEQTKGKMAAILGMQQEKLASLCKEQSGGNEFVHIANYNCPGQYVVGGTVKAVEKLCEKALQNGARRAVILNVSGAFHTPLMSYASEKMYDIIKKTKYSSPEIPVIMNCNAKYLEIENLPELMKKQIESSVYFEDSIRLMINDGIDTFIEIGPGSVLTGLVKKIDSSKTLISINKLDDLKSLKIKGE